MAMTFDLYDTPHSGETGAGSESAVSEAAENGLRSEVRASVGKSLALSFRGSVPLMPEGVGRKSDNGPDSAKEDGNVELRNFDLFSLGGLQEGE